MYEREGNECYEKVLGQLSAVVRIVDDEETVRKSVAFVLRLIGLDVRLYESAEQFLEFDDSQRPGCVVLDIRMPGMNGMQLHKRLLEEGNDLPVLFLTGHGDIDMAVTALKRGAGDFLQKPSDPEKLQTVVRRLVDENINARKRKADIAQKRRKYDLLTQREKDVVNLVCQGELNKVIADKLGITLFTVKIHRANACRKLECRSAVEISDFLRDIGLKDGKNDVRGS